MSGVLIGALLGAILAIGSKNKEPKQIPIKIKKEKRKH